MYGTRGQNTDDTIDISGTAVAMTRKYREFHCVSYRRGVDSKSKIDQYYPRHLSTKKMAKQCDAIVGMAAEVRLSFTYKSP